MELDEDMFLVIVGDEGSPETEPYQTFTIKQEKEDNITPSLVSDEKDPGQKPSDFTELLNAIKEEPEDYEVQFLDEDYDFFVDAPDTVDEDYDPKKDLQQHSKKSSKKGKKSTYTKPHLKGKKSTTKPHLTVSCDDKTASTQNIEANTPQKPKSYVEELMKLKPELADDREALVEALAEVMRQVRPPPLPQDYFVMNDINFECVECGHLSETVPAASRHYSEKHGPRYLICLACGCDFRSTTNLYKHERRCHSQHARLVAAARRRRQGCPRTAAHKPPPQNESKTYPCTMCSATFRSPAGLKAHINCHLGRRPYMCSMCTRAYSSGSALYKHLKTHSGRQFVCAHCQRAFKLKAALVAHMDTHKPERKFPCSECPQRFAQRAALELHVRRAHEGLPLPCACALCPARYPRMSLLKKHVLRKHELHLMTKTMFYKQLPTLTETQLPEAAVVANADLDYIYLENELHTLGQDDSSNSEVGEYTTD